MANLAQPIMPIGGQVRGGRASARRIDPFRIFSYAVIIFVGLIYIMPLVWMAAKSVMTLAESNSTALIPTSINLSNYTDVLFNPSLPFLRYLENTVLLEILSVSGQIIVCVLAAYGFSRIKFPGRDLLFGLFLLTIFVPSTVTLVPKLILVTNFGWIDNWTAQVIPFLASTFSIFLLRQLFMQVP